MVQIQLYKVQNGHVQASYIGRHSNHCSRTFNILQSSLTRGGSTEAEEPSPPFSTATAFSNVVLQAAM